MSINFSASFDRRPTELNARGKIVKKNLPLTRALHNKYNIQKLLI